VRLRRLGRALLAAALLAAPGAGAEPRWQAAALSGSDRLLAFSLLRERPAGYRDAAAAALERAGALPGPAPSPGPRIVARRLTVAPALAWDDNVNGGVPGARLGLGPFVFTVDEESRAKAGLVLGLDAGAEAAWAVGRATRLSLQAGLTWRHAPALDLGWQAGLLRGCAARMVAPWRWIEGCAALSGVERALSSTAARRVEARTVALVASRWGDHRLSLGAWAEDRDGSVQPGLSAGLLTATGRGAIDLTALLGAEPAGRGGVVAAAGVSFARVLASAPTRLSLGVARERGGEVLGDPRRDDVARLGLARGLPGGAVGRLGLSLRRSTIELYDDDLTLSLGVQLRGLEFWR
jgi:hypothetical protein